MEIFSATDDNDSLSAQFLQFSLEQIREVSGVLKGPEAESLQDINQNFVQINCKIPSNFSLFFFFSSDNSRKYGFANGFSACWEIYYIFCLHAVKTLVIEYFEINILALYYCGIGVVSRVSHLNSLVSCFFRDIFCVELLLSTFSHKTAIANSQGHSFW